MADDLKRVGLVFKADGSDGFVKSLKLINAELSENYKKYKLTQEQWDKSITTTQKLNDRLEYLNRAYDLQSSKVRTLKDQLQSLEEAEKRDEVAISKKRAQLTQAETSLQRYKNQIEETTNKLNTGSEAIKAYGDKVQEEGAKIEKAGKKISAFSVATLGALTASAKGAIEFEDAFTGVEKTVDGTAEEMEELKQGIRDMAKEIPSSTTEISKVAELAGQLGIEKENILDFSRSIIDLSNSTNLSAEEGATQLARFANIMQMSQKDFGNLGSSIVALGNNFATTEPKIVEMAMRLAGAGKQVGLTEGEVMGLATALSSVGIEAEMGGSAISKAMVQMQNAVEMGGEKLNDVLGKTGKSLRDLQLMSANNSKDFKALAQSLGMTSTELNQLVKSGGELEDFAKISGMTAEQFKKAWKDDAAGALTAFIQGLGTAEDKGESAIGLLTEMGLSEVRLRDSLLRAANAGDLLNNAIEMGNKAFKENTALTDEANKRYETLKSKMQMALSKIKDIGITLGNKLMPSIEKVIDKIGKWTDSFSKLDDKTIDMILNTGLFVSALGPAISILGKTTSAIGGTIKAYGSFREGLGSLITKAEKSSSAMSGLLGIIKGMTIPVGLACTAIGVAIAGIAIASNKANEEVKKDFTTMGDSASNFIKGIDTAESHLSSFNSTLFASTDEQQELKQNMDDIQKGITEICKKASDERRDYTQEEITQLDEYFTKLRELKNREIEIQNQIAEAITQQAKTNAESFKGSLDEYKIESQEWIKTATEQKEATIRLIQEGTIEEVALLNQRYKTEEERQSEAYQKEYNAIMEHKQTKIDEANDEVAKVTEVYANGYFERSKQEDGFFNVLKDYSEKIEKLGEGHNKKIEQIKNGELWYVTNKNQAIQSENETFKFHQKEIWDEMYKNMSDSQAEQLGVWLALQADTEMYGGKISNETQSIVDSIIASYDSMPQGTREAMKNAMTPMLDEMNKKEPSLFAKAKNIANGILTRLRQAFDIHSPSRKTRQIMKYAMQPMEEEMEKGKKELFKQADEMGEGIVDKLGNIEGNVSLSRNSDFIKRTSNNGSILKIDIDYEKITKAFLKALNSCKMEVDEDGFIKMVDNRLMEVM